MKINESFSLLKKLEKKNNKVSQKNLEEKNQ